MYLLNLLRHQGLSAVKLSVFIAYAVNISRLLYVLPEWGGLFSVELFNRINVSTSATFWIYNGKSP